MGIQRRDTIYMKDSKVKIGSSTFLCRILKNESYFITGVVIDNDGNVVKQRGVEDYIIRTHFTNCGLYGKHPVTDHTSFNWFAGSGYAVYPHEYEMGSENAHVIKTHPSYGLIGVTRTSGKQTFFGSSIEHSDYFTLRIATASHDRKISNDWYYKEKDLIEVKLTANQFMNLLTGMNRGDGEPCTISRIDNVSIPEPPFVSQVDMYNKEFKNKMAKISEPLKAKKKLIEDLLNGKTVNKAQKEEIVGILNSFIVDIESNVPFVQQSFSEQMTKTITETKAAVEAIVTNRIIDAGIDALGAKNITPTEMLRIDETSVDNLPIED